jgi:hypothetical protein
MVHRKVLGDGIHEELRVEVRRVVHYIHIGVPVVRVCLSRVYEVGGDAWSHGLRCLGGASS